MPRAHGRVHSVIWDDEDFIALETAEQRLYMFLLSQPDLSHAGLIPLRVRRWARKVASTTADDLYCALANLEATRFVAVDHEAEELLVRTFVRNDGVWKQPKVMLRMRLDAQQIESPRLRAVFRKELDRLPLDEIALPSTREQVERVVDDLRSDFAEAEEYPSEGVSDTHPDTPRVRAGAFPLPPSPFPLKNSPQVADSNPADRSTRSGSADESAEFIEFYEKVYPRKEARGQARKAWKAALKKASAEEILEGARTFAASVAGAERRFIAHPATWLNGERWADVTEAPAEDEASFWNRGPQIPAAPPEIADDPERYAEWLDDWRRENGR